MDMYSTWELSVEYSTLLHSPSLKCPPYIRTLCEDISSNVVRRSGIAGRGCSSITNITLDTHIYIYISPPQHLSPCISIVLQHPCSSRYKMCIPHHRLQLILQCGSECWLVELVFIYILFTLPHAHIYIGKYLHCMYVPVYTYVCSHGGV